ncbi:(deoxy)nucleoside triphosphate pyrophosphohydrolase [Pedobacter sp. MC2016-14]|uniref:(deoxy)nucleoside triphosphate pyrophosphohydrolase n=1 Tax=Pedobacter sp. MC2016-14 TaxID=2897327 RepID=UPI001E46B54D|nr:(deoxy)nucleoside triphosphate pyrophosphohydrolase [Pedobacter sp. MC2016-14]MCD0490052.1 (deoxy)nucleoside triphosphate pyrophosphohydrolase [Pedobacter sp. MC2016-14]
MVDVTCAIIVNPEGQVLVTQRSATMKLPLKWEFPGGKMEFGETPAICLIREIKEELNVTIKILSELPSNKHNYPDFSINLIPFICEITEGSIELREHSQYRWLHPNVLLDLDWAEADLPIVANYLTSLNVT